MVPVKQTDIDPELTMTDDFKYLITRSHFAMFQNEEGKAMYIAFLYTRAEAKLESQNK